jgi:anaerobilin synthase
VTQVRPRDAAPKPIEAFFARTCGDPLADAFPADGPVHPEAGARPVPPEAWEDLWQKLAARPRQSAAVAYVHVPFCDTRCLFCGFYRSRWREEDGSAYVDALVEQLRRGRDLPHQGEGPVQAVYFGGGTPSLLAPRDLARALAAVREHLPLTPDCEITLEGRVQGFGMEKAWVAFDAGVNRLSIGVQTFDEGLRRSLGRRASRRAVIDFLEGLVAAGQGAVVIDLIYGLPSQSRALWEEDVATAIGIGLDGRDLYSRKLMSGTPLQSAVEAGRLTPVPAVGLGAYYRDGAERLAAARWESLSTSHWRNGTRERNLYNLAVKSGADCLAFGAGAGGSLAGHGYRLIADPDAFRDRLAGQASLLEGLTRPLPHRAPFDRIRAGLERGRLDLTGLAADLSVAGLGDPDGVLDPLLAQWQRAGLLIWDGAWADLTLAGRFWQTTLTRNLLEWVGQALRESAAGSPQGALPRLVVAGEGVRE